MAVLAYALTTLTKVKAYLGISVSTFDTVLETLIDGCTEWIEEECGNRRFFDAGTDATEYHDGDYDSTGRNKIFPKRWPINSITSISYRTGNLGSPTWVAFTTNDYEKNDDAGIIYLSLPSGRQNIKLIYKGGYTTIPADLDMACVKLVAKEFDKRKSQGLTQESVGSASISWNEDIDPEVKRIIRKYSRIFR